MSNVTPIRPVPEPTWDSFERVLKRLEAAVEAERKPTVRVRLGKWEAQLTGMEFTERADGSARVGG